jgi:hypothetical protein
MTNQQHSANISHIQTPSVFHSIENSDVILIELLRRDVTSFHLSFKTDALHASFFV